MSKYLKILVLVCSLPLIILLFENSFRQNILAQKTEIAARKFKNIKVLGDMPADDMGKVMNIMSESLGVNCDFCHYGYEFEKEGKEEHEVARKMIRMTWEINRQYFEGKQEVSCSTCHNGRPHPLSVPNLNPGEIVERRQKQPEKHPDVDEILDRFCFITGGVDQIEKVISRYIRAERIEPDGTREQEEIWQKSGKLVISTFYPPNYTVIEGFDGRVAWKKSNSDAIVLKPDETGQIRRTAELFAPAPHDIKAAYPNLEYDRLEKINGRDVHVLRAKNETGTRERLFFDAKSWFLIRRTATIQTVLGAFVYQVDYNNYRAFGSVRIPLSTRVAMPGISFTRRILTVKVNAAIDDGKFAPPAKPN